MKLQFQDKILKNMGELREEIKRLWCTGLLAHYCKTLARSITNRLQACRLS